MQTASRTDSFRATLCLLLDRLELPHCFEWGIGHSTEMILQHPGVKTLDSVENDEFYLRMVRRDFNVEGAHIILERDVRDYCLVNGNNAPYDLIFVDGKDRVNCLRHSLEIMKPDGVVVLHDAKRRQYQEGIDLFKHKFFTDFGHTAILVNDDARASKISELIEKETL